MAQRIALHYVARDSLIHRWDPRYKLAGLLSVSALLYYPDPALLILPSFAFLLTFRLSRVPVTLLTRSLRYWIPLLGVFFLVQAVFGLSWRNGVRTVSMDRDVLASAALNCWRLLLMVLFGILFTAATRPRDLRDTILWALRPVPGVPECRVALMVTLTVRFFAIVLDLAAEVASANRARLAGRCRSPLRRAKALLLPLFRRSLTRADDLAMALAARGYREYPGLSVHWEKGCGWLPVVLYISVFLAAAHVRGWLIP